MRPRLGLEAEVGLELELEAGLGVGLIMTGAAGVIDASSSEGP